MEVIKAKALQLDQEKHELEKVVTALGKVKEKRLEEEKLIDIVLEHTRNCIDLLYGAIDIMENNNNGRQDSE